MSLSERQREEVDNIVDQKMHQLKDDVYYEISVVNVDLIRIREEIQEFRGEVHESLQKLSIPLNDIASSMQKMAGLPDAWSNFKGFLMFLKVMKEYWFVLLVLGGVVATTLAGIFKVVVG